MHGFVPMGRWKRRSPWGRWGRARRRTVWPFALNDRGAFAAIGYASEGPSERPVERPVPPIRRCVRPGGSLLAAAPAQAWSSRPRFSWAAGYSALGRRHCERARQLSNYRPSPGPSPRNELWNVVRRPDGRWGTARELSGLGGFPVVTPSGQHGALTVFQTSSPEGSLGGLAWSLLPANGDHFAKPVAVSGPNSPEPPTLAANATGEFVIAWHAGPPGLVSLTRSSLAAAVGTKATSAPPRSYRLGTSLPKQSIPESTGQARLSSAGATRSALLRLGSSHEDCLLSCIARRCSAGVRAEADEYSLQ